MALGGKVSPRSDSSEPQLARSATETTGRVAAWPLREAREALSPPALGTAVKYPRRAGAAGARSSPTCRHRVSTGTRGDGVSR